MQLRRTRKKFRCTDPVSFQILRGNALKVYTPRTKGLPLKGHGALQVMISSQREVSIAGINLLSVPALTRYLFSELSKIASFSFIVFPRSHYLQSPGPLPVWQRYPQMSFLCLCPPRTHSLCILQVGFHACGTSPCCNLVSFAVNY